LVKRDFSVSDLAKRLSWLSSVPPCSVLLVATGLSVPNQVDFPGSEHVEGYESVSVDPKDFVGQNVLILGRGNSAFETAENILGVTNFVHMLSRSRVRLSWATHYVGDVRYAAALSVNIFCTVNPLSVRVLLLSGNT
jgi:cation diffusion facilitator CzcD-associated flavoprotein CzcO